LNFEVRKNTDPTTQNLLVNEFLMHLLFGFQNLIQI
jgi:hypothetical protein